MAPPPSSKRKRPAPTNNLASRKRAFAACQFCRLRKTRCDNTRPTCGYCQLHNATCVYDGGDDAEVQSPVFDKGTQRILERLDDLESLWYSSTTQRQDQTVTQDCQPQTTSNATTSRSPAQSEGCIVEHHRLLLDSRRCESLLAWPVLKPALSHEAWDAESLVSLAQRQAYVGDTAATSPANPGRNALSLASSKRRAFSEDDIVPLIRTFNEHVLPRNPVLDGTDLLQLAARIAEHGLDWSAESCLVLLCCALSGITTPWFSQVQSHETDHMQNPSDDDLEQSRAFYSAAQKRLGLLGNELIDVHCFLFACIYEKSILQPIAALLHARQASMRLQFCINTTPKTKNSSDEERSLLQRAIESTSRAESEIVVELGLDPPCRLAQEAPNSLPEPPSVREPNSVLSSAGDTPNQPSSKEEQGWCFYLAEISLRRMMEDTTRLLHEDGPEGWIRDQVSIANRSRTCEEQVDLWAQSIPDCLSVDFDVDCLPGIDFGQHLISRILQWRQMITLPLLYVAIHSLGSGPDIAIGASKCIEYSIQRISRMRGVGRHGGTWFMLRHVFTSAMIISSCRLSPISHLLPPDWTASMEIALKELHEWSSQAADVGLMYLILKSTFSYIGLLNDA